MDHSDTLPPDGIPQDVWDAAVDVLCSIDGCSCDLCVSKVARAIMAERERCETEWAAKLSDPNAVHANMLRGTIAKPSIKQIVHLYGGEVTRAFYRAGA